MTYRPDWDAGPVPCRACGTPMRPSNQRAQGPWENTKQHHGNGYCRPCQRAGRTDPEPGPQTMVWKWRLIEAPVPLLHQEYEALADLMDYLRATGRVLIGRPSKRRVQHGDAPTLTFECTVRQMTGTERTHLTRKGRKAA